MTATAPPRPTPPIPPAHLAPITLVPATSNIPNEQQGTIQDQSSNLPQFHSESSSSSKAVTNATPASPATAKERVVTTDQSSSLNSDSHENTSSKTEFSADAPPGNKQQLTGMGMGAYVIFVLLITAVLIGFYYFKYKSKPKHKTLINHHAEKKSITTPPTISNQTPKTKKQF